MTPKNKIRKNKSKNRIKKNKTKKEKTVTTVTGKTIPIAAETICIHGDGKQAIEFGAQIHAALEKEKIMIQPVFS